MIVGTLTDLERELGSRGYLVRYGRAVDGTTISVRKSDGGSLHNEDFQEITSVLNSSLDDAEWKTLWRGNFQFTFQLEVLE